MNGLSAYLGAIGAVGPGIGSWADLGAGLGTGWTAEPDWRAEPACVGARQARRMSGETLLALMAAEAVAPALPEDAAWVFASSTGEGTTLNDILAALCTDEMLIQPVKFQNAVHNAAVGQWTIARGLHGPATSIAAFDDTVGAALLKAVLQVALEDIPAGLVCFDAPLPEPIHQKRPMTTSFAAGLALMPAKAAGALARLHISVGDGAVTPPVTPAGKALRATGNPAAAILPLLEVLAEGDGAIALGLSGGSVLNVEVSRL